jgi:hypothetical protein
VSEGGLEMAGAPSLEKGTLYRFDFSGTEMDTKMTEEK